MLVIADADKAGGSGRDYGRRELRDRRPTPADVVFESANFDGTSIRQTALALGMRTDASAKFEKNIDPMMTLPAVNRACELVELLGAGEVLDGVIDILNDMCPKRSRCLWSRRRSTGCWARTSPRSDMKEYLRRLEIPVEGMTIHVPSFRPDLRHVRRHRRGGRPSLRLQQHPHHHVAGHDRPRAATPPPSFWKTRPVLQPGPWASVRSSPTPSSPPQPSTCIRLPGRTAPCAIP